MSAYADVILKVNTLECIVKSLQQQLDAFKSGARYMKLQKNFHRVIAGYEREIKNLKIELRKLMPRLSMCVRSGLSIAIKIGRPTAKK